MNASETQASLDGFEARLEAELVKVVAERAVGRRRRRAAARRLSFRFGLVAGLAAAAGCVAVGLSLGPPPGSPPGSQARASRATAAAPVHIHTAAFTVDRSADGTILLTWDKSRYFQDPQGLQQALRAAGLPVLIKEGVFCRGPHDNGQLDAGGDGPGVGAVVHGVPRADGNVTFVFTPSAVPHGEELFIGYLTPAQLAVTQGSPASVERLVPVGVPLACTTQPPPASYAQQRPTPGNVPPTRS